MKVIIILNDHEYLIIDKVNSILCNTLNGELQILPGHADSFFLLKNNSEISICDFDENIKKFQLTNGMISILDSDQATITCEEIKEINI